MDSKKSNKISDIVRLQQILRKWKKVANAPRNGNKMTRGGSSSSSSSSSINNNTTSTIKFIKRTLSFTDVSSASSNNNVVPKGYLAVCVGKELKRYIIPTEFLGHRAFGILLGEAEEEFGFQQAGVLRIPCEVPVFEKILKVVEEKRDVYFLHELGGLMNKDNDLNSNDSCCCSPDCELTTASHHPQMCR